MSQHFDSAQGPIFVEAEVTGPARSATVTLILDTGATTSLLRVEVFEVLGFNLAEPARRVAVTTGSETTNTSEFVLTRLSALGQHRFGFPVLAHDLPLNVRCAGLLGLDFLRERVLRIDFQQGQLALT